MNVTVDFNYDNYLGLFVSKFSPVLLLNNTNCFFFFGPRLSVYTNIGLVEIRINSQNIFLELLTSNIVVVVLLDIKYMLYPFCSPRYEEIQLNIQEYAVCLFLPYSNLMCYSHVLSITLYVYRSKRLCYSNSIQKVVNNHVSTGLPFQQIDK